MGDFAQGLSRAGIWIQSSVLNTELWRTLTLQTEYTRISVCKVSGKKVIKGWTLCDYYLLLLFDFLFVFTPGQKNTISA